MAFFIFASIVLFWNSFFFQSKTDALTNSVGSIEKRIADLNKMVLTQSREPDYIGRLKFVDTLFHNRLLPSYKDIINDISLGIFGSTIIEQLQIDYMERNVKIKLTGIIHSDFENAYKGYQQFLSSLQKDGYTFDNQSFNTRIDSSRFELELSRCVK